MAQLLRFFLPCSSSRAYGFFYYRVDKVCLYKAGYILKPFSIGRGLRYEAYPFCWIQRIYIRLCMHKHTLIVAAAVRAYTFGVVILTVYQYSPSACILMRYYVMYLLNERACGVFDDNTPFLAALYNLRRHSVRAYEQRLAAGHLLHRMYGQRAHALYPLNNVLIMYKLAEYV